MQGGGGGKHVYDSGRGRPSVGLVIKRRAGEPRARSGAGGVLKKTFLVALLYDIRLTCVCMRIIMHNTMYNVLYGLDHYRRDPERRWIDDGRTTSAACLTRTLYYVNRYIPYYVRHELSTNRVVDVFA